MWLINTRTYELENFINPPWTYSILSHTWEGDEVLFQDMDSLPHARSKAGWKKIQMTCEASRQANISHTWIDTCCIDKRSSAELSEAINSMFAWYQQSSVCYVYLSDLVFPCTPVDTIMPDSDEGRQWADAAFSRLQDEMKACRWFTRGWTLQELIAPSQVVFLDQNWNLIGSRAPGSDPRFIKILERLTGIPISVLEHKRHIATIPVAQRMSWAARRETTRVEDIAYCLLGIFDVNMPLLYGEGSKSFFRLQEEIVKNYDDLSLFAWKQDSSSYGIGVLRGCFANSPAEFASWLNIKIRLKGFESGMEVTSKNVNMDGRILRQQDHPPGIEQGVHCILDLGVRDPDDKINSLGIRLMRSGRSNTYFRFKPSELITLRPRRTSVYDVDLDNDYSSAYLDWKNEEALESLEQKAISIRKSISIKETFLMGHFQKPVFKIHWHEDVLKVLKSVNGRSTREFIPSFECHPSSAFHEDGTLTWVTDFELQINPQHVVSLVLVTGLQWSTHDRSDRVYYGNASLNSQEFWAVILGEGRAYVINERGKFFDQPAAVEIRRELDEDNSTIVRQLKQMDHRERGKFSDCDYELIEPYTALSYVWGDASQRGVIHLGDSAKEITASLDAALRDLRDKSRVCRIWADALCIDQSNNSEKGVQVALMGRIYSTAHHTVIHLGKSPPGLKKLFMDLRAQSQATIHGNTSGLGQLSLTADEIDEMRRNLVLKPWFRRVWVFQELVLSTDVWVQCDDLRIRWHHFCEAVDTKSVVAAMLLDTLSDSITQQSQPRDATALENMNSRRYDGFKAPLSTLLSCRRGVGVTDPRDIVFGHLGVVSDRDRCDRFIKVDYDRDLARVSVDAARYFLDDTGIESLLLHAMNPSPINAPGIPSWCPRWSRPQVPWETIHKVGNRFGIGDDSLYLSFGGTHHMLLSEPPVLAISEFEVTRIKATSHTFSSCDDEIGAQRRVQGYDPRVASRHKRQRLFRKFFKTWVDAANHQEYPMAERRDVQRITNALTHHLQDPETSPLSGKRLSIISSRQCALVAKESQEGDIVTMLVNCYKHAVLRPKQVNDVDHLSNSITSAFEQANISDCPQGPMRARFRAVDDDDYDEWISG
ncbi:beta transducin [Fusarium tjaetaba]|uniref:Beta transducin n=1 Tax=Fusarium tjaetaba TaxID=1567544 RepID=A0A8H5RLM8_9HYPO|nr:beta transducin [Fusarium tjaetaba]KAF5635280.1 beta transducin [Fusarium tjaetaba]